MIEFTWPFAFLALPLPLLIRLLPGNKQVRDQALKVPFFDEWMTAQGKQGIAVESKKPWRLMLLSLAWIFLVTAAAKPEWIGEAIELPVSGRDLMLAVDLSESMKQTDFQVQGQNVNRLEAVKAVAGEFIERRVGDRIGLILFGARAYIQTPLTFDVKTVRNMLDESVIGLAGQYTAIGDAIGLAVKRLRDRPAQGRVLILLTDGANTAGEVEPVQAAALAANAGLKIYTIGVGAEEVVVNTFFGSRKVNPSVDLDEETLTKIAKETNGKYFRAKDTKGLESIYEILDQLEPIRSDSEVFRPKRQLFYWFLAISLALFLAPFLYALFNRIDSSKGIGVRNV